MALSRPDLIAAVETAVGALANVYRGAATESDLYEAALLAIAVQATRSAGGFCLLTDNGRSPA